MSIRDFFRKKEKAVVPVQDKATENSYVKVTEHLRILYSADIGKWRSAHQAAISTIQPNYSRLIDVYEDALLDTHLSAVLQHRTLNVMNTPFRIKKNGEVDDDLTALLNKRWMYDLIQEVQRSIYFGYTCLEWHFDSNGEVSSVSSVLRHHIIPQRNELLPNVNLQHGVNITEEPFTNTYTLIKHNSLGLLLECCKYTIFKKYATSHWQQLQQLFGIPMRVGRTSSKNQAVIDKIFDTLKNMGTAGFGVLPEGTMIEFIENGKNDPHNIFQKAIEVSDNQLSMRVLGTPNSDKGGSYAKEKVNYARNNDITKADLRYVVFVINDQILPLLNKWGYDLEGATIEFDPTWSLDLANNQLEIDQWLFEKYKIPVEYIHDTYGVPVEEKEVEVDEPKPPIDEKKKVVPTDEADELENVLETTINESIDIMSFEFVNELVNSDVTIGNLPPYFETLIKDIYNQKLVDGTINQDLYFDGFNDMWESIRANFGLTTQINNGTNTANWLQLQQNNIYAFSAAKSFAEMQTLRDLVFDGKKIRPFGEFRKDALKIYGTYNENWLKTEFDAVKRGTVSGKKWLNIQRDKDIYPYLMYKTKGDKRVRDEHADLDGLIFHVDNPIWKTIYPPNGWNCRCYVVQLRKSDLTAEQLRQAESSSESERAERIFKDSHKNEYWHKNVGEAAILDYKNSNYMSAMNVGMNDLEAVRNYGLRSIDDILSKETYKDLQSDELTAAEWFKGMMTANNGKDNVFSINTELVGTPIGVGNRFVDFLESNADIEKFITTEFENVLLSPNEIWSNTDIDTMTFVKYYNGKVVSININQDTNKHWFAETMDVDNDVFRKGVLLYRK